MMQAVSAVARAEDANTRPRARVASPTMPAEEVSAIYPPPSLDLMYRQSLTVRRLESRARTGVSGLRAGGPEALAGRARAAAGVSSAVPRQSDTGEAYEVQQNPDVGGPACDTLVHRDSGLRPTQSRRRRRRARKRWSSRPARGVGSTTVPAVALLRHRRSTRDVSVARRLFRPAARRLHEPVAWRLHEPVTRRLHEPVTRRLHEPVARRLHEPVTRRLHEPVARRLPVPVARWSTRTTRVPSTGPRRTAATTTITDRAACMRRRTATIVRTTRSGRAFSVGFGLWIGYPVAYTAWFYYGYPYPGYYGYPAYAPYAPAYYPPPAYGYPVAGSAPAYPQASYPQASYPTSNAPQQDYYEADPAAGIGHRAAGNGIRQRELRDHAVDGGGLYRREIRGTRLRPRTDHSAARAHAGTASR